MSEQHLRSSLERNKSWQGDMFHVYKNPLKSPSPIMPWTTHSLPPLNIRYGEAGTAEKVHESHTVTRSFFDVHKILTIPTSKTHDILTKLLKKWNIVRKFMKTWTNYAQDEKRKIQHPKPTIKSEHLVKEVWDILFGVYLSIRHHWNLRIPLYGAYAMPYSIVAPVIKT